jgi:hypothetical protein
MKFKILTFVVVFAFSNVYGQLSPVDVADLTIKVGAMSTEEVYYGFSEGDQLVFNFQELKDKELKEIEIIELPSSSKFMDFKTKSIDNKMLNISRTGIYKFRFVNTAIAGRVCKIKIQRISASESTRDFNSSVYWKTIYDTSYTIFKEKYLVSSDTIISTVTEQVAKVHSQGNVNGNRTSYNFTLPQNTVSWSYYIGVDQAGQKAYENAANQISSKAAPMVARLPGYGPLAALALGSVSYLTALQTGEDVDYYIVEGDNVNLFLSGQQFFYVKKGKVINDYSRMLAPVKGNFHVCLSNDNAITPVSVTIKIVAIVVNEKWGERPIKKMNITTQQVPYLQN